MPTINTGDYQYLWDTQDYLDQQDRYNAQSPGSQNFGLTSLSLENQLLQQQQSDEDREFELKRSIAEQRVQNVRAATDIKREVLNDLMSFSRQRQQRYSTLYGLNPYFGPARLRGSFR